MWLRGLSAMFHASAEQYKTYHHQLSCITTNNFTTLVSDMCKCATHVNVPTFQVSVILLQYDHPPLQTLNWNESYTESHHSEFIS